MYYICFGRKKNDYDYIYLTGKYRYDIKYRCLTWFELYCFIRDNNIDFKNVKFRNLDLFKLFYHFMNFTDMENYYILHTRKENISKINETFNERTRI